MSNFMKKICKNFSLPFLYAFGVGFALCTHFSASAKTNQAPSKSKPTLITPSAAQPITICVAPPEQNK